MRLRNPLRKRRSGPGTAGSPARRSTGKRRLSERDPRTVGAVGLAVLAAILVLAFNLDHLPLLAGGHTYHAAFRDASGLVSGNEVRVAGVKVGTVTGVDLARAGATPYVRVTFRADTDLGDQTAATIRIRTVLGQKYLALAPAGSTPLAAGAEIPLARTATPLDVVEAVNGLADIAGRIDVTQLAESFGVLSDTFAGTPAAVKASLTGLTRLSQTVASRDAQLRQLLAHARTVTGVLAQHDEDFQALVSDANLLLDEVRRRRQAIDDLLTATVQLSTQLSGLVADTRTTIGPALRELSAVEQTLRRHRTDLENTVKNMAPFIDTFTNVVGNGRWFDSWVDGLLQPYQPKIGGA